MEEKWGAKLEGDVGGQKSIVSRTDFLRWRVLNLLTCREKDPEEKGGGWRGASGRAGRAGA